MPNRTLKESIRESESINMLSPEAECTWYRLITYADDFGLFKAHPRLLLRFLYPLKDYTEYQLIQWLNELSAAKMVGFYVGEDGRPYGLIVNWLEFNKPRNAKPKYPQPIDDNDIYYDWATFENNCLQMSANGPEVESSSSSRSRGTTPLACKQKQNTDSKKPNGKYPPPTLQEVKEYFTKNGYLLKAAQKAFDYYEANKDPHSGNWKDSKGNVVKAWKQKMISVWFKDENRSPPDQAACKPFDREKEKQKFNEAML